MPKFVISYDLLAPSKDYEPLWAELRRLGTKQVLYSQWAGNITGTAAQVRDHLRRYTDSNDRILVMDADGPDWAGYNLLARLDQM